MREEGVDGGDWEPLAVLLKLQEAELSRLARSLTRNAEAVKVLRSVLRSDR